MERSPRSPCIWDATEIVLKASVEGRDQALAALWVGSYVRNMVCFPRLNVLSDNVSVAAHRFATVPNVSLHQLEWPQQLIEHGLGQSIYHPSAAKKLHGLPPIYYSIQWPFMWADNFTSPLARHVLILDTDTLPVLPLRCHHLFDEAERPVWHTWAWPKPPGWLAHTNAIFANGTRASSGGEQASGSGERAGHRLATNADFMTFFPVVIPRAVLPVARAAIEQAYGRHFDAAWLQIKNPSYGDLVGKAAALHRPETISVVHCPSVGRPKEVIPTELLASHAENACRDFVTVVEHLKHPFRDCHTGKCHHLARANAVRYGAQLLERAATFTREGRGFPSELYHYQSNRSLAHQQRLEARAVREDRPGRVCGLPDAAAEAARVAATLPASRDEATAGTPADGAAHQPERSTPSRGSEAAGSEAAGSEELVRLVIYDNKYNRSAGVLPRHLLYRSAAMLGVPVQIGSLVPASVRRWQPGDRELWLMQTLPQMTARLALLLDGFDTVLMARAAELSSKWRRLAGPGRILISTEKQMWPEEHEFRGQRLAGPSGAYPRPPGTGAPREGVMRYINIGALLGAPSSLHALLRCMQTRYASFPYQCPIRHYPNGTYEFASAAPFRTRRFGSLKGAWGWEQSCFHMYWLEQTHGLLPPTCPSLVLDFNSDLMLNFNKIGPKLVWPWNDSERMLSPFTDAAPCVLHANGAGKYAMPVMHFWWDVVHSPGRQASAVRSTAAFAESERKALTKSFTHDYLTPWIQAMRPQVIHTSSSLTMLRDALRFRSPT